MPDIVTLVTGLGLLFFGVALIFFPEDANDPYRKRKFGFAKGSLSQLVFGAVALLMGGVQMYLWLGHHL